MIAAKSNTINTRRRSWNACNGLRPYRVPPRPLGLAGKRRCRKFSAPKHAGSPEKNLRCPLPRHRTIPSGRIRHRNGVLWKKRTISSKDWRRTRSLDPCRCTFQIPTAEYAPREIKKSIAGNGSASKQQVQFMVKAQLHMHETPKFFDISDALAVALCHAYRRSSADVQPVQSAARARTWTTYIKLHPEKIGRLS